MTAIVVDEAERARLIEQVAHAAGLEDRALLTIAKRGLSPSDAVADLKSRYPQGFKADTVKQFKDMTDAEARAFEREHGIRPRAGQRR